MDPEKTNRLGGETSPYLLQHAQNPVDWHPWGAAALGLAGEVAKPVLLSIGYSACHWCHVMAHESFENDEIAALMNELFINIKVDREERPDLDKVYQTAHQLLTQRPGGWPLTVFLDPADKLPFFAGTYFPPEPRHGMPAFADVLKRVAEFYQSNRADIQQQKAPMIDVFRHIDATDPATGKLDDSPLRGVRQQLEQAFDPKNGGFGGAPKFPHPGGIERLLYHWAASRKTGEPDVRALYMATFSLESMIRGGVYDQLGGGFYRYSVDAAWRIPHFEKMLYDNGPLLALCAEAFHATGQIVFRRGATETADWVLREMRAGNGAFYSTLDADSEGEEGLFYAWDAEQVRNISGDAWPLVEGHFGLDQPANFEGRYHLWQARPVKGHNTDAANARTVIDNVRMALFAVRDKRVHPGRDEKILTSWNAMMIRGLAISARALDRPDYAEAATAAVSFLRNELWRDGRLLATWKDGKARFAAYLDDHAYLIDALLELLQCRWDPADLAFAIELADLLLDRFADTQNGGFYFTADDHEELFHRSRPLADDATPSGNAIAAKALLRLGYLIGEPRYLDAAERTLRAGWEPMRQHPQGHASLIAALAEYLDPPEILVLRGVPAKLAEWQQRLGKAYAPQRLCYPIPNDASDLPKGLAVRAARGDIFAYVCRGHSCSSGGSLDDLISQAD